MLRLRLLKPSMKFVMILVAISLLAGCSTSANSHSVHFSGTIETEGDQFVMDGNVSVGINAAPDATFENVTVVLYDETKNVIRTVAVGELSTSGPPHTQRINITTGSIPSYVVIESPDFWQSGTDVYVSGYRRPGDGSRYEEYSRANASEKFTDS